MNTQQGHVKQNTRPTVTASRRAELRRVLSDEKRATAIERVHSKYGSTAPQPEYIPADMPTMIDFTKAGYDDEHEPHRIPQAVWDVALIAAFVSSVWGTAQMELLHACVVATFGGVMAVIHPPIRKFIRG